MDDDGAGEGLVGVAFGHDAVEAEMIKGLLEKAGIPSLLQPVGMSVDGSQLGFLADAAGRKPRDYGLIGAYARIYLWSFVVIAVVCGLYFGLGAV